VWGLDSAAALRERFEALTAFLEAHRSLWEHRPFVSLPAPWEVERPALAAWLRGLSPEQVEAGADDPAALPGAPAELRALMASARALSALPRLGAPPLPGRQPRRMPGRKWTQVAAFGGFVAPDLSGRKDVTAVTDWCAGVGHLGRTLGAATGLPLVALERSPELCESGRERAARAGVSAVFHAVDVLRDPLPDGALGPDTALVSLHACGALTARALTAAVASSARSVIASPCCYHSIPGDRYAPLSRAGAARDLNLDRRSLWLPCAEEVTGVAVRRRLRRREMVYRAAMASLIGVGYLPFRAVPSTWIVGDFHGFALAVAEREGLALPGDLQRACVAAEAAGRAHVRAATALALVRAVFRRPLEIWLALDRALFLIEAGWSASLSTFCERPITPRNIVIAGNRPPV